MVTRGCRPERGRDAVSRRLQTSLAVVLTGVGLIYLVRGYALLWLQNDLTDMRQRVSGLADIRAGGSPYTSNNDTVADAPWGWLGNAVLFWPPLPWSRAYYGLLILATVVLMMWWGYRVGVAGGPAGSCWRRRHGRSAASPPLLAWARTHPSWWPR